MLFGHLLTREACPRFFDIQLQLVARIVLLPLVTPETLNITFISRPAQRSLATHAKPVT